MRASALDPKFAERSVSNATQFQPVGVLLEGNNSKLSEHDNFTAETIILPKKQSKASA